ncbi:unnamed protein product, partial [Closterium sp. NIES-54]
VLQHKLCALVMTSLRSTGSEEGDVGEPGYRRLVLRCVATLVRQHHAQLTTECEVFLLMLVKRVDQDLPLWHRILVLEVLRVPDSSEESLAAVAGMFSSKARGHHANACAVWQQAWSGQWTLTGQATQWWQPVRHTP